MANRPYTLPNILDGKFLGGLNPSNGDVCTLEATVVSGFEGTAKEEVAERFLSHPSLLRGRLFFDIPINRASEALKLRAVDNVNVMAGLVQDVDFPPDKEKALEKFNEIALELNWEKALQVWKNVTHYDGDLRPQLDEDLSKRLAKVLREAEMKTKMSQGQSESTEEIKSADISQESPKSEANPVENEELASENMKKNEDVTDKEGVQVKEIQQIDGKDNAAQPELAKEEVIQEVELQKKVVEEKAVLSNGQVADNSIKDVPTQGELREIIQCGSQEEVYLVSEPNDSFQRDAVAETYKGPKFRVTCHRVGNHHAFGSMDAAKAFGAGVFQKHHWKVDMTEFDIEIILNIDNNRVYVSLALCKESLFKRNICAFGRTVVRSTMCYNILRLAHPSPGDIIIDPMCGSGTLPIEGSIGFPWTYNIGGDVYAKAVERTRLNVDYARKQSICAPINPDVLLWDIWELPVRQGSVDIFVTDLPYGKRMGKQTDNRVLYLRVLRQMAFASRLVTGKAVLMTHDKASMIKGLQNVGKLWKNMRTVSVNHGGLNAFVFVLYRTNVPFTVPVRKDKVSKLPKKDVAANLSTELGHPAGESEISGEEASSTLSESQSVPKEEERKETEAKSDELEDKHAEMQFGAQPLEPEKQVEGDAAEILNLNPAQSVISVEEANKEDEANKEVQEEKSENMESCETGEVQNGRSTVEE